MLHKPNNQTLLLTNILNTRSNSTIINECGMSIYSAGESHFSEDMYMGRKVSFWLANIQESIQNRSYFYEDGFKISIYSKVVLIPKGPSIQIS